MTIRELCTFIGVADPDIEINFDDLVMNPIHPEDYCLKISSTESGDVYWQFCRNGLPVEPNLIEERYLKTFIRVAYNKIYEKDQ